MSNDTGIGLDAPLSPSCLSRCYEKQQLSDPSDRSAQYVERVRQLEAEIQRLSHQLCTAKSEITKEKANAIEADKYRIQFSDLHGRVAKLEKVLKDSKSRRLFAEGQVKAMQQKLNTAENQRKNWEDVAKKLRVENDNLRKQLTSCQKQLEGEASLRIDLETRLRSLREGEEVPFKRKLLGEEASFRVAPPTEIKDIKSDAEPSPSLLTAIQNSPSIKLSNAEKPEITFIGGVNPSKTTKRKLKQTTLTQKFSLNSTADTEENDSFFQPSYDKIPRTKSRKPEYKYKEVVRKKGERCKLPGRDCRCCKEYFVAVDDKTGGSRNDVKQLISRHRAQFQVPSTPKNFWNVDFSITQTK